MHRYQLEHAIRAACNIIRRDQIIIVGSQSILGSFHEDELPEQATMSTEVDILPIDDDPQTVLDLSGELSAVAGEWSIFDQTHGFFLDGVDDTTAKLTAYREKDQAFVGALLQHGIVERELTIERLHSVQELWPVEVGRALEWFQSSA